MEQSEAGQRRERPDDDVAPFLLQRRQDRRRHQIALFEQTFEFMRHHDAQPGEERHDVDRKGDEEGIAPAPVKEIGFRHVEDGEGEQAARHDQRQRRTKLRHHRIPATLMLRRVERKERGQTVPGAAQRDTLRGAKDDQDHRSIVANRLISG